MIKVTYDVAANAAMIYLDGEIQPRAVAFMYSCDPIDVSGMINLDFDSSGHLVGIEVLGASQKLPASVLANAVIVGRNSK